MSMILEKGRTLNDRYEILEKIGIGGMSVVYRAKDKRLGREVTIKVLKEEFAANEDFKVRFKAEATSAAILLHPNIVNVYDVGEENNIDYIVMEYVKGDTLKLAIKEKAPFDSLTTVSVALQIAAALSHAHKNHIVHRDIKPQNIMLSLDGTIKVMDFGIAKAATASTLTNTDNALGSVHYFSPEQARGGYVDEKSDIYSLGITMFEMVTGALPFEGDTSVAVALKHINNPLPNILDYNPKASPAVVGIIRKATQKSPDKRYANIELMLADLKTALGELSADFARIKARAAEQRAKAGTTNTAPSSEKIKKDLKRSDENNDNSKKAVAGALSGAAISSAAANAASISSSERTPAADPPKEYKKGLSREFHPSPEVTAPKAVSEDLEPTLIQDRFKPGTEAKTEVIHMSSVRRTDMPENSKDLGAEIPKRKRKINESQDYNIPESMVGFDRYSKKLHIKPDDPEAAKPRKYKFSDDGTEDFDYDKNGERKVVIAAVATAAAIIIVIVVFGFELFGNPFQGLIDAGVKNTSAPTTEALIEGKVPSFVGLSYDDAKATASELGLDIIKSGEQESTMQAGTVVYQDIEEGTEIKEGMVVSLIIAKDSKTRTMPDVMGNSEDNASLAIKAVIPNADITLNYEFSEESAIGKVLSQSPNAGDEISDTTPFVLSISKGEEFTNAKVPNLIGLSADQAQKTIQENGLAVGSVTEMASDTVASGFVITQTLKIGDEVPKGSVISIVVSTGAESSTAAESTSAASASEASTQAQTAANGSKTLFFTIRKPDTTAESVKIKLVKKDASGSTVILETTRLTSEFPFDIPVSGSGEAEVEFYVNGEYLWSEKVTF